MSNDLICVIYARTACDDIRHLGVEEQHQLCRQYAKKHGLKIIKEYADIGVSGLEPNKPALKQLQADVEQGGIDQVIVRDAARLHRGEPLDYSERLAKDFQRYGTKIVFAESFPKSNLAGASGIIRTLKRAMANQMEVIMPDITMCDNATCHMRQQCYRFMATPDARQSVTTFAPLSDLECEYFMPLKRSKFWQEDEATDS